MPGERHVPDDHAQARGHSDVASLERRSSAAAPLASVDELRAYREKLTQYETATAEVRRAIDKIERPILLRTAGGEGFAKFTPELQAMIAKPPYDRSPYEYQIAELALRQMPFDLKKFETKLDDELKTQLGDLTKPPLTAIGSAMNEMTSPLYGADAYLDKPFEFTELERQIAAQLA